MIPENFCGLPEEYSEFESSRFVIIPVPYERTVSYLRGVSFAPSRIIDASKNLELYDEELELSPFECGIHTMPLRRISGKPDRALTVIENLCRKVVENDKFPILVGGEHTCTLPIFKVLSEKYSLSLVHFDAHLDLRDSYLGEKLCHASVMARIYEITDNILHIGIRTICEEESKKIDKIRIVWAKDCIKDFEREIKNLNKEVYLSIDVDVFDPSVIPDVGTPEPGGIGWYEMLYMLSKIFKKKNVVGFDVVELAPKKNTYSEFTVAKLIYKLIGYKCRWSK